MGNLTAVQRYAWGERRDDGCSYVHNLLGADRSLGLRWAPREFRLVGILQDGLECDFDSLVALSRTEPKGLLVATEIDTLIGRQDNVLEACRLLQETAPSHNYNCVGTIIQGEGIVLTFPRILDVGCTPNWTFCM